MQGKKVLILLIFLLVFNACNLRDVKTSFNNFKDNFSERMRVFLHGIPFIKKYVSLPPAPKKLYNQTEEIISKLKLYNTQKFYQKEYKKLMESWREIRYLYKDGYYLSARKELEKLFPKAKELLKRVKNYREILREKALQKYKEIAKKAELVLAHLKKEKQRLKIKLYLWKLKLLIDMERYNEFNKAIKNPPF